MANGLTGRYMNREKETALHFNIARTSPNPNKGLGDYASTVAANDRQRVE